MVRKRRIVNPKHTTATVVSARTDSTDDISDRHTWPKTNADWWRKKIETNKKRDRDTDMHLANLGWKVVRFWEHEPTEDVADRIETLIKGRSGGLTSKLD